MRRLVRLLVAVAVVASLAGWLIYRWTRPEVRRPGEDLPDITRNLAAGLPADAPEPRFTDVTEAAGLAGFRTFAGPRSSQLPEDMGAGAAWGDFDNDGDDDLFLVAAGAALDRPSAERAASALYENLGDGTFRPVAGFPETRIVGMAAAWGDYDADGWLDLAVTGYGVLRLFRNREGRLEPDGRWRERPGYWAGAAWGDFDGDRDLDLYVCGYVRYAEQTGAVRAATEQYGKSVPYTLNPASFEPERNLLFQNRGDGTFEEVAELYGVSNPGGRSLTALWHDFDADGRLDLYVANDISDNALYLNRGETFEDAGLAAWVADYRGAMGLAVGDWNRDGDDDLFVTHWVAQENALYDARMLGAPPAGSAGAGDPPGTESGVGTPPGRAASPPSSSTPGRLAFSDLAAPKGLGQIALPFVGWGTEFVDLDADGWLDLPIVNGSTFETDDEPRRLKPQVPLLMWNERGERFHDLAPLSEPLAAPRVGRGLAVADYDADGDQDLLVVDLDGGARLLRNDMQTGNWLALRLRSRLGGGGQPRGRGEGSIVVVEAGGQTLRRAVGGSSYLSQSSSTLHFGLGAASRIDRLEVRWHAGEPQGFDGVEPGALWELTEGDPVARRVERAAATRGARSAGMEKGGSSAATTGAGGSGQEGPGPPGRAGAESPEQARARLVEFWNTQRAAMDAMKIDGDLPRAVGLFRRALELDPAHEDSRYYLANCLAALGEPEEALAHLDRLRRQAPQSHRAHKQWGVLRAMTADSPAALAEAEAALGRALELNQEETGGLLVLGELALLRGEAALAAERFELACRTNPRAVGGFFLRAYVAWKAGRGEESERLLAAAHAARGDEWKPEGAVAEGDVAARMHREVTPLSRFWQAWDGRPDPAAALAPLDDYLRRRNDGRSGPAGAP